MCRPPSSPGTACTPCKQPAAWHPTPPPAGSSPSPLPGCGLRADSLRAGRADNRRVVCPFRARTTPAAPAHWPDLGLAVTPNGDNCCALLSNILTGRCPGRRSAWGLGHLTKRWPVEACRLGGRLPDREPVQPAVDLGAH